MRARLPATRAATAQRTTTRAGVTRRGANTPADLLELQRTAGNRVVAQVLRSTSRPTVQRKDDEVLIEDVPDEPQEEKVPKPIAAPTGPLLLADRPWAEIETEQRERRQVDDPRYQKKLEDLRPQAPEPGPLSGDTMATSEEALGPVVEGIVAKQERIKKGYKALEPAKPVPKDLAAHTMRRRKRQLAPFTDPRVLEAGRPRGVQDEVAALPGGTVAKVQADLAARPQVEAKRGDIEAAVKAALKKNDTAHLGTKKLTTLQASVSDAVARHSWSEVDGLLDSLNTERALLESYLQTLQSAGARITKLDVPHTSAAKKYELRMVTFKAFQDEVKKPNRNDATATQLLTALDTAIQAEENKVTAADLATQNRIQLQNQGLWPANGRQAAIIHTATRATVGGSPAERAAVVEALDAFKDPTRSHSWARVWGTITHGNAEGNLPGVAGAGGYKEYYVRPPGSAVGAAGQQAAGPRRLVVRTNGDVYYSHNHYGDPMGRTLPAFVKITDP